MADITAKMVNDLRQRTNAPMMDAKRALVDANGDPEKAVELLRERGSASADKKLANDMKEGLIAGKIAPDGKTRRPPPPRLPDRFRRPQRRLPETPRRPHRSRLRQQRPPPPPNSPPSNTPTLAAATVEKVIKEHVGTIKENIGVTGLARFTTANGRIEKYVHHNAKVGTLVQIDGSTDDAVKVTAGEIAMHVTAGVPTVALAVDRHGIDPAIVEKEKAAAAEGITGKPPAIIEKIVAGKLEKSSRTSPSSISPSSRTTKNASRTSSPKPPKPPAPRHHRPLRPPQSRRSLIQSDAGVDRRSATPTRLY